ncbi:MAG TPA: alpha-galactosidase [Candidatus Brocadiia bacterium]|nr:alpha-galactosidase [Candidatus Brocadiia bacterium]
MLTPFSRILLPLVLLGGHDLLGAAQTGDEQRQARSWAETAFGAGIGKLPFSFTYGGKSYRDVLSGWTRSDGESRNESGRNERTIVFRDSSAQLVLTCKVTAYLDFPAAEWVLSFENKSDRDTPIIADAMAADLELPKPESGDFVLHYAKGSQCEATDFAPLEKYFSPGEILSLSPFGGRSSDGVAPYFNLASPGGGIMAAIGWSGQWAASFEYKAKGEMCFKAGMEQTHLKLRPGESIRTPAIILLFYSGERMRGHNLWRNFILEHCTPKTDGKPIELPVAASGAAIGFNNVTTENQIVGATNVADKKLDVDTWWIDAGWSEGGFAEGMGTWSPDAKRFPRGLEPVSEVVHKRGLKFLIWFEPERVMPGTQLRRERPEWLLAPSNLPDPIKYQKDWRLLNLGNPDALKWAIDYFSGVIKSASIDLYRHDFNMHPLYYWRNGEAEDRLGMNEIKYIEGLYCYFETLEQRCPGLLMDNCASGGRRLDFEMMRRTVPLWRTDYCWEPNGAQNINYGLSFWLPRHGLGAVTTDKYDFRSGMGANVSLAFDFYNPDAAFWGPLAERIREYRGLREFFQGDFYPLTAYAPAEDSWIAWQYHRPDLGSGMVQAFRRAKCDAPSLRVKLSGLDPEAAYKVTNIDADKAQIVKGGELMENGIEARTETSPGSAIIIYRAEARR